MDCRRSPIEEPGYDDHPHYYITIAPLSGGDTSVIADRSLLHFIDILPNSTRILFVETQYLSRYQTVFSMDYRTHKIDSLFTLWILDYWTKYDAPSSNKVVDISSDGKYMYTLAKSFTSSLSEGRNIYRVTLDTKEIIQLTYNVPNRGIEELDLSDDDNNLVYSERDSGSNHSTVTTMDVHSLAKTIIQSSDSLHFDHPQFVDHDTRIFYEAKKKDEKVSVDQLITCELNSKIITRTSDKSTFDVMYPFASTENTILISNSASPNWIIKYDILNHNSQQTLEPMTADLKHNISHDKTKWLISQSKSRCDVIDVSSGSVEKTKFFDVRNSIELMQLTSKKDTLIFVSKKSY